jgi:hypothetical protein
MTFSLHRGISVGSAFSSINTGNQEKCGHWGDVPVRDSMEKIQRWRNPAGAEVAYRVLCIAQNFRWVLAASAASAANSAWGCIVESGK